MRPQKQLNNLLGISSELDSTLRDFAYLAGRHQDFHPANGGDVSQVLTRVAADAILHEFEASASPWFEIRKLDTLATIRNDGRSGFRTEGITDERFYLALVPIATRLMLITRTGSDIPSLGHTIATGEDGLLLNVVQVDQSGRRIRIVYGNAQYGSIPSIETHIHLLANAVSLAEGSAAPSAVHAHPPYLVALGRHPRIRGDERLFNAALYTSVEGINRNYTGTVGVVPYFPSGSARLVEHSLVPIQAHELILWMNHGFLVRGENIRRGYTLTAYAELCAQAALDTLRDGSLLLPDHEVIGQLRLLGLEEAFEQLFYATPQVRHLSRSSSRSHPPSAEVNAVVTAGNMTDQTVAEREGSHARN